MKKSFLTVTLLSFSIILIFAENGERMISNAKKNLKIAELIPEMYNSNPELADMIFDVACIQHVNGVTEKDKGPEAIKNSLAQMKQQFERSKTVFHELIAQGNSVAVRWTWTAVQIQTGEKWSFNGNTIFHLKNGKVIEYWAIDDRLREMTLHGFTITPPQK